MKYLTNIDLNKNELQNAILQPLATSPANPKQGQFYFNSVDKVMYQYTGTEWKKVGGDTDWTEILNKPENLVQDANYVHTDNNYTTTEKTKLSGLKNYTHPAYTSRSSGFYKVTVDSTGHVSAVTAVTKADITGLGIAPTASPALTGTPTAPTAGVNTNSTQIATTAFVKTAIDNVLSASEAMVYKGTLGTSGTITSLPASHNVGDSYKIITAGTYAGAKCEVGDMIICVTTGTSAKDSDWTIVQSNIDGAVTGSNSSVTANTVAIFDGTTGRIIKSSGFTIASNVPANAKFTDTTYSSGSGITIGSGNKINHSNSISSGTASGSSGNKSFGDSVNIPSITYDENGHITSTSSTSIKLPSNPVTRTVKEFPNTANTQTYTVTGYIVNVTIVDSVTKEEILADVSYSSVSTSTNTSVTITTSENPTNKLLVIILSIN